MHFQKNILSITNVFEDNYFIFIKNKKRKVEKWHNI